MAVGLMPDHSGRGITGGNMWEIVIGFFAGLLIGGVVGGIIGLTLQDISDGIE